METVPYWKRIWKTVNCTSADVGEDNIEDILELSKDYLINGILKFSPYNEEGYKVCLNKVEIRPSSEFGRFIEQLSLMLNLETSTTWAILCNYLMFEFHGKIQDMNKILQYSLCSDSFMKDIWNFYSLERLFIIKISNYIWEEQMNPDNRFRECFEEFLETITYKKVQEGLVNQYKHLTDEIFNISLNTVEHKIWIERNIVEQEQILYSLLISLELCPFNVEDLINILRLFKKMNFNSLTENIQSVIWNKERIYRHIRYLQIAILVVGFKHFWNSYEIIKPYLEEINSLVEETYCNEENMPVLLTWTVVQMRAEENLYDVKATTTIVQLLESKVFLQMYYLISCNIFKDCIAGRVVKSAIYTVFDALCVKYSGAEMYFQDGAVVLVSELLKEYYLSTLCLCGNVEGVKSFFSKAMSLFPHHFQSLSTIMQSLISLQRDTDTLISELCNLRVYTKLYKTCHIDVNEKDRLTHQYQPLNSSLITFPVGTEVNIVRAVGGELAQFHCTYDYFDAINYVVTMFFNETEASLTNETNTVNMVVWSYKLLLEIIKIDWKFVDDYPKIKELVLLTNSYMLSAILKSTNKNFEVLKLCYEIAIIAFKYEPNIITSHLTSMKFLPTIANNRFSKEIFLNERLLKYFVLTDLFQEEHDKYQTNDLLLLYVRFVNCTLKANENFDNIKLAGLMYILFKIFPNINDESFITAKYKQKLILEVSEVLYDFMKKKRGDLSEHEFIAYNCTMELFLSNRLYYFKLFKFLDCTCNQLQLMLTSEVNWKTSSVSEIILITKRTLGCISMLLNYLKSYKNVKNYSLIVRRLFSTLESGVSILKMIAEYFDNYFDKEISIVACNILSTFASITDDSLMHTLKMDDFQVQCVFLERLRDELEDEEVQIAIIKLITNCVDKQIGITSAFFKEENSENTAFCFIVEFINNMGKDGDLSIDPVQQEFFNLLHEIWARNKQQIIKKIVSQENFWTTIILPLYKVNHINIDLSLKVLEILIMELCTQEKPKEKLTQTLEILFNPTNNFLKRWFNQIIVLMKTNCGDTKLISLVTIALKIMKKFLFSIRRYYKNHFEIYNKSLFELECLKILLIYSANPNDITMLTECLEFCSLFPSCLTVQTELKDAFSVLLLKDIVNNLAWHYSLMDDHCKTMMLGILVVYLKNYKENLLFGQQLTLYFLPALLKLFSNEYENLFFGDVKSSEKLEEKNFYSWLLILRLINMFVEENMLETQLLDSFLEMNYLQKLADFIKSCIIHPIPLMVVETTILCFMNCAQSNLINYFNSVDLQPIYQETAAAKYNFLDSKFEDNGLSQNFLVVFDCMLKLNGIFLKGRRNYAISSVLYFIYSHQQIFVHIMTMATLEADVWHLKLVVNALHFLYEALRFRYQWTMDDRNSLDVIATSIKKVLNTSIGVMLRPKILVFTQDKPHLPKALPQTDVPEQTFINTCNEFVEIITWSCLFFTRCNPNITNLLSFYKPEGYKVLIEYDFRIPPAVNEEPHRLTYGGLLCVLRFFCKTLSQVFLDEKVDVKSRDTSISEDHHGSIDPISTKDTPDIINVLYRFGIPEMMNLPAPWFLNLNIENIKLGVDAIITFLAGQAFLAIRDPIIERSVMSYIKRELCAELIYLYKMVDKIIIKNYFSSDKNKIEKGNCELVVSKLNRSAIITDIDEAYLVCIVSWFTQVCGLVHNSKFDEFLSNWHAKSTWINQYNTYIKNTSVNISDDE